MAVIKLSAFAGEKPVITPRLLPETAARAASNVRLNDGALTPINKTLPTRASLPANQKTIYRHQGEWLSWPMEVWAAPGPVAQDRLYYTGDGAPKMRIGKEVYPLAVPRPTVALSAALSGDGTGNVQSRAYVYTYVTSYGEESAPSPISPLIDWKPGQKVTLSNFAAGPADRSIELQRIYRSQTGSAGTYLYLIAERANSAADFVDNIDVDAFQEALPSADWNAPPDELQGLISMPNGMMAAFKGRSVYFCEPYRPHAWPEKYSMSCDTDIVGLGAIGTSLIVMTKGQPYLMQGSSPETMQSAKLEGQFPCINSRAIVDVGHAICYPSNTGLVAIGGDGGIRLVTAELFDRDDWLMLSPATAFAAQHAGVYVLFYRTIDGKAEVSEGSLFINVAQAQYLVRAAASPEAAFYSLDDEGLYFTLRNDENVYQYDAPGGAPEMLRWKSKEFWSTRPLNFGAIKIDTDVSRLVKTQSKIDAEREEIRAWNEARLAEGDLHAEINGMALGALGVNGDGLKRLPDYDEVWVSVYANHKLVATVQTTDKIVRLPAAQKANLWEIDVVSNVQITQIVMAGTVAELGGAG